MASAEGSVSRWIQEVNGGKEEAELYLWDRYFPHLVRIALAKLRGIRRAIEDEEDVAARALKSFFSALRQNRYPNLADRDGLWRLLWKITSDKARDLRRRRKREPVFDALPDSVAAPETHRALPDDDELASNLETMMTEEVRRLLEKLGNAQLRRIAIAKLEDYTNEEIAIEHDCSVRTIERRLNLIRKKWKSERA